MGRTSRIACGVALVAVFLAGCRYNATYTINADDTVSGRIYTALYQDPAADPVDASVKSDADTIAASFTAATETPHNEGSWVGYYVYFTNEPLATFADPPTTTWDVQILKVGGQYQVFGYTATDENATRTSAINESGYLELDVYFPGTLVEATGASETNVSPGWAHFDLLAEPLNQTPYAKGNGPAAPPEPEPVHTVIITPAPEPVVTPVVTPVVIPSASPSSTVAPLIAPHEEGNSSIPVWVWAVGGALVAALAGMIGYTVATRKPKVAAEKTPEPPNEEPPTK